MSYRPTEINTHYGTKLYPADRIRPNCHDTVILAKCGMAVSLLWFSHT